MAQDRLTEWIAMQWHSPTLAGHVALLPLSLLWRVVTSLRRAAWRTGLRRPVRLPVPVIVVGNLSVGGSGKTPLVEYLVVALTEAGLRPGIVSRGHGGSAWQPRRVTAEDDARVCGDEPVMLARRTGAPVAIGRDRPAAAQLLLPDCDVIVSDDGLQHYALGRDVEMAVIDGETGLGNGRLLPAGPLREPPRRLTDVDFIVVRDGEWPGAWRVRVAARDAVSLVDGSRRPLHEWRGERCHAIAGIGRPGRFFDALETAGLEPERHPFPDHHPFEPDDLDFGDDLPVLMTEKDAVKCRRFADNRMWYVPATVEDLDGLAGAIIDRLGN